MLSKAQIKRIRSLQLKKYREAEGFFIAEGKKIVEELIDSEITIEHIYALEEYIASLSSSVPYTKISKEELDKVSALTTAQGVVAVCKIPEGGKTQPDLKKDLVLALDEIKDPGNMGTIIRIADWFGINHIYCSEECVDTYNPKVIQASMGSIARVKVQYVNLSDRLSSMGEGIPVYGALLSGKNIYKEKLAPNGILVIGNESNGVSQAVQKYITNPVSIPSYNLNGPESLNAAIATAILCAEFRKG
jgi:TrmH family RNA methyltransferase